MCNINANLFLFKVCVTNNNNNNNHSEMYFYFFTLVYCVKSHKRVSHLKQNIGFIQSVKLKLFYTIYKTCE